MKHDAPPILFKRHLGGKPCSIEQVRALLSYDPETGKLWWKPRGKTGWDSRYAGKEAFTCQTVAGYRRGFLLGRSVKAHRVAWAIYHGEWPLELDHINGEKADNRISNLRAVDRQANARNRSIRSDNNTGIQGVCFRNNRWIARIHIDGKERWLGAFRDKDAAVSARKQAERINNYHENHGRP